MKKRLYELRYGGSVIALAYDPAELFREKCELVFNRSVRYPELLEIYSEGREEWIFDEKVTTTKRASYLLYEGFPYA